MPEFKWSKETLKQLFWALIVVTVIALVAMAIWWRKANELIESFKPVLSLVGFVVGPLLAILGFFATRLDKVELLEAKDKIVEQENHL